MIEFKQRLLTANFLKYEVLCEPNDNDKDDDDDDKEEEEEEEEGEERIASSGEEHGLKRRVKGESTLNMRMTDYRVDRACETFEHLASLLSESSAPQAEEYIAHLVS